MTNDVAKRLGEFAAGLRGSMWQSRNETIILLEQAKARIEAREAQLAEARREALREAMEECTKLMLSLAHDVPAVEHTDIDTCIVLRDRISALLDAETPAQPKPDAVQEAAKVLLDTNGAAADLAIELMREHKRTLGTGSGGYLPALRYALRALAGD